jgi:hypothetical protein
LRDFLGVLHQLVSYVGGAPVSALEQVIAGLLVFTGASMVGGLFCAEFLSRRREQLSYVVTSAGLALGALSLIFALWTLHQTRKLERLQGEKISAFDVLIDEMTKEIRKLIDVYSGTADRSLAFLRFYLLTNNPYFGLISFPGEPRALGFRAAIADLAERVRAASQPPNAGGRRAELKMRVICGDRRVVAAFNDLYFRKDQSAAKASADRESEDLIAELERAGTKCVVRVHAELAELQYAIIGDVVFEFILESPRDPSARTRKSQIRYTNRIEDGVVAARFARFADVLITLVEARKDQST